MSIRTSGGGAAPTYHLKNTQVKVDAPKKPIKNEIPSKKAEEKAKTQGKNSFGHTKQKGKALAQKAPSDSRNAYKKPSKPKTSSLKNLKAGLEAATEINDRVKDALETLEKYPGFLKKIGLSSDALKFITKSATPELNRLSMLSTLIEASKAFESNDLRKGLSLSLKGLGQVWGMLPQKTQEKMLGGVSKLLQKTPLLKGFDKGYLTALNKAKAIPDAFNAISSLLDGSAENFASAMTEIGKKSLDGGQAIELSARTAKALIQMLPKKQQLKMMVKVGGRKIPVLGTLAILASDLYDIYKNPDDRKTWLGLSSTAMGAIPIIGTAASTALDIGLLIASVKEQMEKEKEMSNMTKEVAFSIEKSKQIANNLWPQVKKNLGTPQKLNRLITVGELGTKAFQFTLDNMIKDDCSNLKTYAKEANVQQLKDFMLTVARDGGPKRRYIATRALLRDPATRAKTAKAIKLLSKEYQKRLLGQ